MSVRRPSTRTAKETTIVCDLEIAFELFLPQICHAVLENRSERVSESFVTLPGAHYDDGIAFLRIRDDVGFDGFEVRRVDGVLVAEAFDLFDQRR